MTSATPERSTQRPRRVVVVSVLIVLTYLAVVGSLSELLPGVIPSLRHGTLPADPYPRRYVEHPWQGALHVVPGLIFVLGAPLQLSARFRRKHLTLHRRLGRVLVVCGLAAATFGLVFGVTHPYGGLAEVSSSTVFGVWLFACLVRAYRAIRRRDVAQHRRWMIRAFAVGIGIGTVRVWVGILGTVVAMQSGVAMTGPEPSSYGYAFWIGFGIHVLIGEWWLRRPSKPGLRAAT